MDANTNQSASSPSLALDSSGNPVVSWEEYDGASFNIYVKRWNGRSWVQLGTFLDVNTNRDAYNPSLALDSSGNPVVSWHESDGTSGNIYVKRWNGRSWVQLGTTFLDVKTNQNAFIPSLALDSSGNPVVSWYEYDGTSDNIYVKRWNGSSWVRLGTFLDVNTDKWARNPSLALDSSGNPVVSWYESDGTYDNIYVKQWNGRSWVLVGSNPLDTSLNNDAFSPSLSLVNGSLAVAWQQRSGGSDIYVKKYITNSWQDLGDLLDVIGVQSAVNSSIARKSNNNPVVAWDEADAVSGTRNVYVKEWTGSSWSALAGALDRIAGNAENPSVALRSNMPVVAFQENTNVYVRRWTGTAWANISNAALDTVLTRNAITPSLAIESTTNLPIVAFAENGNILVKKANGVQPASVWNSPFGTTPLDTTATNVAYRPSLALKSDNKPIVAWYEKVGTNFNIYAKEWNGTSWVALGGAIDKTVTRDAKDIVLAIRGDNRPVVAWEEAGNVYVKRWNGTAWVNVGGTVDQTAANEALRPALDLRSDNNPVVTWQEWNGSSYDVWVKRWIGSSWTLVASVADKNASRDAKRPSLVLKSDNNPIISWDEWDGVSENVYVKQF